MNLRQKLFGPLLLIVTIPVIIVGGFAYTFISDITKTSLINSVNDVSQSLAPSLNEKISSAETNLRLFTSSRLLQDYIVRGDERYSILQPSLIRQLNEYQYVYPDYYSLKLILANGEVDSIVDNREDSEFSFDESDWGFYQLLAKTNEDKIKVYVEQEPKSGKYILSLGLPLIFKAQFSESEGKTEVKRNYFTLSLYLDYIETVLKSVTSSENSFLVVVDPNDNILFSTANDDTTMFQGKFSLTDDLQGFYRINSSAESFYVSTAPLAHGFKLYAIVPTTKFNQTANELAVNMLLVFVGIILSIFVISLLYIQGLLLRPIYSIKKLVSDITQGDMDSIVVFKERNDELGELSKSIIKMRSKIKFNNEQIEKLAYFDELTSLPNRLTMHIELDALIARANRTSTRFALVFLDLDNFKDVNDTL